MNTKNKTDKTAGASQNVRTVKQYLLDSVGVDPIAERAKAQGKPELPHVEPYGSGFAIVWPDSEYPNGENWEGGYISKEGAEKAMLQQSPSRPQAQPSPLPWRTVVETEFEPCAVCSNDGEEMVHLVGGSRRERATNARLIVASVNHAEALAEALRLAIDFMPDLTNIAAIREALAKWEGAK